MKLFRDLSKTWSTQKTPIDFQSPISTSLGMDPERQLNRSGWTERRKPFPQQAMGYELQTFDYGALHNPFWASCPSSPMRSVYIGEHFPPLFSSFSSKCATILLPIHRDISLWCWEWCNGIVSYRLFVANAVPDSKWTESVSVNLIRFNHRKRPWEPLDLLAQIVPARGQRQ